MWGIQKEKTGVFEIGINTYIRIYELRNGILPVNAYWKIRIFVSTYRFVFRTSD